MRVNPLYAAGAVAILISALIVVSNKKIKSSYVADTQKIQPLQATSDVKGVETDKAAVLPQPLKTQQPGIYIQGEEKDTWNDDRWEAFVTKTVNDSQALKGGEDQKVYEQLRKTPAEFKRRIDDLNKRIAYYEGLKRNGSRDPDIQKKLENLYILKSTLLALENKIVVPQQADR